MELIESPKDNTSVASSPYSSPNVGALLKIKILSWSHETGLPVSVRVRVGNRTFNVHKFPLFSKSGYFKRRISEEPMEVELPPEFPGGPDTFEMILLFIYGSTTLIDPFNVATLRCAAEFLHMTEDNSTNNLCDRFDLYMNQVVLQNWDDTLIVLQKCQSLVPLAEELLIVSRCIESLAFMACMEILDPERRRDYPVVTLESLSSRPWSSDRVKEILRQELWIKDLIALPFDFFKRVMGSLRRQGMKEKYVGPMIVFYATKWALVSKKTEQKILQGILYLLPLGDKASKLIPVGFYFALLSKSLEVGLRSEGRVKVLQDHIVSMLHYADLCDLISSGMELSTMERIVSMYVASSSGSGVACGLSNNYAVGELWDAYLTHIAVDPKMEPDRFVKLVETVPVSYRQSHDNLYRAVYAFLQVHKDLTQEEKGDICKYLSCQKLSHEVCAEAVQNELMPLRLIVQALFVQQLNTQQAFKECSDSFRYNNPCSGPDFSGSLSSSRCPLSSKSPYTEEEPETRPLGFLLQKDQNAPTLDVPVNDGYESTSFRIQTLEHELLSLKRSLRWQNVPKIAEELDRRSMSKRRNNLGQMSGCIGSVMFSSRRKYVSGIMKIFRRITISGSKKSKMKPGTPNSCPM